MLTYVERPGGRIRIADRESSIEAGDLFVIAPGEVVGVPDPEAAVESAGWVVFFPAEVLGVRSAGAFLGWRGHPLLFPFLGGAAGGPARLSVPPERRAVWTGRLVALDDEIQGHRQGYHEAVLALLTLLLVDVARLAARAVRDRGVANDSLLARVFDVIESGYPGDLSLRDVARQVGLSPEHLTTVVRQRTGRTVGSWIAERRMAEARALLVQTDLPVARVAERVGYRDPAYFARVFRRTHGGTPRGWRAAAAR